MKWPQHILDTVRRRAQLDRIADSLLQAIESGRYTTTERLRLLRSYEDVEHLIDQLRERQRADEEAYLLRWSDSDTETE